MTASRMLLRLAMLAALASCVTGCLGPGPVERTLRLPSGCEEVVSPAVSPAMSPGAQSLVLAVLPFESAAALDRRAVAVLEGQVARSATSWSWEDSPRRLVTQALMDRLACSGRWGVLWPYTPRGEHDAVLSGRVTDFSVTLHAASSQTRAVRVALVVDVWAHGKGPLLARIPAEGVARLADESPQAVAVAAGQALQQALDQVLTGLDTRRPALQRTP